MDDYEWEKTSYIESRCINDCPEYIPDSDEDVIFPEETVEQCSADRQ